MLKSLSTADVTEIRVLADDCRRVSVATNGGMLMLSPGLYQLGSKQCRDAERLARRLYRRIAALSNEARHELTAVMWIGRGDEDAEDMPALVQHARNMSDDGDIAYLAGKEPLADYLRAGISRLAAATTIRNPKPRRRHAANMSPHKDKTAP